MENNGRDTIFDWDIVQGITGLEDIFGWKSEVLLNRCRNSSLCQNDRCGLEKFRDGICEEYDRVVGKILKLLNNIFEINIYSI